MNAKQAIYGLLSVVGLVLTWMYNLRYIEESSGGFDALHFFAQGFVNSAGSSITVDLLITVLAVPLFLLMRKRHLAAAREAA